MSSQPSKTTPSKGFTCDCEDPNNPDTTFHKIVCWKVPKCKHCNKRTDKFISCVCEDVFVSYNQFIERQGNIRSFLPSWMIVRNCQKSGKEGNQD